MKLCLCWVLEKNVWVNVCAIAINLASCETQTGKKGQREFINERSNHASVLSDGSGVL